MNLTNYHIRALLAPIYQEACFDAEINMIVLAEMLEYLASAFEEKEPHSVWSRLHLNKDKYDRPEYMKYLVRLQKEYYLTLARFIAEQIQQVCANGNMEEGYELWQKEYTDALVQWDGIVYGYLCEVPFEFTNHQPEIDRYRKLNVNTLDGRWAAAQSEFLSLAYNEQLSVKKRSSFLIYAGQVELYHPLPDYARALVYFNQASEIHQGAEIQSVMGEYYLKLGNYEKARTFFLQAIEAEPTDLNNYLLMGDSYRDEAKYDTAEQWYDDALHMNFLDTGSYRRKLVLYGHANRMQAEKSKVSELLNRLELIRSDHAYENIIYNTYRDAGYAFLLSRDYVQSIFYYQKAIRHKPNLSLAHIDIGYVHTYEKNFEEAECHFQKTFELGEEIFESYWGLAYLYEQTTEWHKAIESYRKCLKFRTSSHDVIYNHLGILHEKVEALSEAEKCYQRAWELRPEDYRYYNALRTLLERQGKEKELYEFLKAGIRYSPDDPLRHNDLGLFYFNRGELQQALECFSRSITLNSEEPVYLENIGLTYEKMHDYENAEKMYRKAMDLEKNKGTYHNRLGVFYNNLGENDRALPLYLEAIMREPKNILYRNNLGIGYNRLQRWEEAEEAFREALKIDNNNALSLSSLGLSLIWQKKFAEAESYLQKAIALEPNNIQHYDYLGYVYEAQLEYERALELYLKALSLSPEDEVLNNRVGIMHYVLENYAEAIRYYKKAIHTNPGNAIYFDNLGLAYSALNDQESADEAYSKSKALKDEQKKFE